VPGAGKEDDQTDETDAAADRPREEEDLP